MLQKFKALRAGAVVLVIISLGFCYYNWNGALSGQYKGVNNIAFGASIGIPVAMAIGSLVLALMAYSAMKQIERAEKEKKESEVQ